MLTAIKNWLTEEIIRDFQTLKLTKFLHDSESESEDDDLERALKQISLFRIWMFLLDDIVCWIHEWVGIGLQKNSNTIINQLRKYS